MVGKGGVKQGLIGSIGWLSDWGQGCFSRKECPVGIIGRRENVRYVNRKHVPTRGVAGDFNHALARILPVIKGNLFNPGVGYDRWRGGRRLD